MSIVSTNSITVNGEPHELADATPLVAFLQLIEISSDTRGVAVAVNDEVIRKEDWATAILRPGDRVEVVTAKQGG